MLKNIFELYTSNLRVEWTLALKFLYSPVQIAELHFKTEMPTTDNILHMYSVPSIRIGWMTAFSFPFKSKSNAYLASSELPNRVAKLLQLWPQLLKTTICNNKIHKASYKHNRYISRLGEGRLPKNRLDIKTRYSASLATLRAGLSLVVSATCPHCRKKFALCCQLSRWTGGGGGPANWGVSPSQVAK